MKVFVCEYVTGGGLYPAPIPASLLREGDLMLQALLKDLLRIPGVRPMTCRDARLPRLSLPVNARSIASQDVWGQWEVCMNEAEAVWPIAPETGGVLGRLSSQALRCGKTLLGSHPDAIALTASKYATSALLCKLGVRTIPTCWIDDPLPDTKTGAWVVKPDDGVGCDGALYFETRARLESWMREGGCGRNAVVQPYLAGTPASISALFRSGRGVLLGSNLQHIEIERGMFRYRGSAVNALRQHDAAFSAIVTAVAAALPGLSGYAGIDVIVSDAGIDVVEINPRLTTSYAGLRQSLSRNPAQMALEWLLDAKMPACQALQRKPVEVALDD